MRALSPRTMELLRDERAIFRNLLWIGARLRSNGALAERGWWNDVYGSTLRVIDTEDNEVIRPYVGGGDLISIASVPLVTGLTAQNIEINLSIASDSVDEALREWDPTRAPVEIHRAILDPDTLQQTEPAFRRFIGIVDGVEPQTGEEQSEGRIRIRAASLSQELHRAASWKRSHQDQQRRAPGDTFFKHTAVIGEIRFFWGDGDMDGERNK